MLKRLKPTTPTNRHTLVLKRTEVMDVDPEKSLLAVRKERAGRNNHGKITVRHQGGGVKRRYRIIDFKRDKKDVAGVIATIEYDPNRNANIALVHYRDGEKRYILAPAGITIGETVISGEEAEIKVGNALPLKNIPLGITVHNVELTTGKGGQLARSAGASMQIQAKEGKFVQLSTPSGEIRLVNQENYATIGKVGNDEIANIKLGKAGRSRHKGVRPSVRGMAMHAEQHPHGGGESKGHVGGKSKDIWGNRRGVITRKRKNISNKFIIRRRKGRKVKK